VKNLTKTPLDVYSKVTWNIQHCFFSSILITANHQTFYSTDKNTAAVYYKDKRQWPQVASGEV